MKKLMILATCAAIAAVACTKIHEVTPVTQGPEIGLGTWTNTLTKAYTNTWANNDAFSVFATKTVGGTTSSVFEDTKVTYDGSKWGYTSLKYWDVTASNYTFYAFLPFNGSGETNGYLAAGTYALTGQFQTKSISFANPAGNDQDILVATKYSRDKGAAASLSTADVELVFNHMTSLIDVKAKMDASLSGLAADGQSVKVTVTDVKLADIKNQGTFTVTGYNALDAATNPGKPTYTGDYGWTASGTTTDYVVFASTDPTPTPVVLTTATTYTNGTANTGGGESLVANYILMPQELIHSTTTPSAVAGQKLVLSYTIEVWTTGETPTLVSSASYTNVSVDFYDFITTDRIDNVEQGTAIGGWNPGHHYTYTVTIGAKPIVFGSVSVNAWTNEDPGYYYLVK